MQTLRQALAITLVGLSSLPRRAGPASVMIISVAGVVAVLASVLAVVTGLSKAMEDSGRPDRAIVLRSGSSGEITSVIERDQVRLIADAPGVLVGANGKAIVSAEAMSPLNLVEKSSGADINVTLRGMTQEGLEVWPEMKIVSGRVFRPGLRELIVGKVAAAQVNGMQVGETLAIYGNEWSIVGAFDSGGNSRESELIADAETVMSISQRNNFQSVTVRLKSAADFDTFKTAVTQTPSLNVTVTSERDFLKRESDKLSMLLKFIAYGMGGIMATGAVFVALNAMYSAVNSRRREIATLRAIGFAPMAIIPAIVIEATLLAAFGGLLGALLAWIFFNGASTSTSIGSDISRQLVFSLRVNGHVLLVSIAWALGIGAVGGLLPAIRSIRAPVTVALRAV
jgi:putative ABC transport system permease protein